MERFELRELSIEIMHEYTEAGDEKIRTLFASETGYQTPKVDVRGVIFQDGKSAAGEGKGRRGLGIARRMGGHRSIACRSCCEGSEGRSGLRRACREALAVLDKKFHNHPPSAFHVQNVHSVRHYGRSAGVGTETSAVGFSARTNCLRCLRNGIRRSNCANVPFENNPHLPTWLD